MRKTAIVVLLLALACGKEEPGSRAAIERDLEERTIRDLYEEAEKIAYTPPADGLLTDAHIERYVRVRGLAREITKIAEERLDEQMQRASNDDNPFTRMGTAFAGFGNARNVLTADVRAALMLNENPHELYWVSVQIDKAAATYLARRDHEKRVVDTAAAFDNETDRSLRDRKRREWEFERERQRKWLDGLGDATLANSKMVEANRLALLPYHEQLARKSGG